MARRRGAVLSSETIRRLSHPGRTARLDPSPLTGTFSYRAGRSRGQAETAEQHRLSKHVICMRGGCIRNSRGCLSSPLARRGFERPAGAEAAAAEQRRGGGKESEEVGRGTGKRSGAREQSRRREKG